jgi:glucans biosynthesis protein C
MASRAAVASPRKLPVSTATSSTARVPTERPIVSSGRDHALDGLRAAMMLMGILLHAGLSYTRLPTNPIWPFKDRHTSVFCDAVMMASGLFRMPVFFLIAGFFAALICRKRGVLGLIRNRAGRILVPFVVGWFVTFPLVRAGFLCAEALNAGAPAPMAAMADALLAKGPFADPYPIHLWFLEYLLIYYAIAIFVVLWSRGPGQAARRRFSSIFRGLIRSRSRIPRLASLTAVPLLAAPMGVIPTPLSFVPEPVSLMAHGTFFAFGWTLFAHRDLMPSLAHGALHRIMLGLLLLPPFGLVLKFRAQVMPPGWFGPLFPGAEATLATGSLDGLGLPGSWGLVLGLISQVVLALISSLTVWLLVLGISGLFLRTFGRPIGWVRYLADASYWLYLAHFPSMIWVPILLAPLEAPALVKLALVLLITMGVMLLAYEAVVRATVIGAAPGMRGSAGKVP